VSTGFKQKAKARARDSSAAFQALKGSFGLESGRREANYMQQLRADLTAREL
jgi:hypothetical protein